MIYLYNNISPLGTLRKKKLSCERSLCRSPLLIAVLHFRNVEGNTILASNLNWAILKKYLIINIEVAIGSSQISCFKILHVVCCKKLPHTHKKCIF